MSFAFDTLAYVRRLRDAKVPPEQAEAMADALTQTLNAPNGVATKSDIAQLDSKVDRLVWMVGVNLTISLLSLGAMFTFLLRNLPK